MSTTINEHVPYKILSLHMGQLNNEHIAIVDDILHENNKYQTKHLHIF